MYKRIILIPYKMGSKSCKALKDGLVAAGIKCVRKKVEEGWRWTNKDLIIYYGGTKVIPYAGFGAPSLNICRYKAQNKLIAFQTLQTANLSTVEWTTNPTIAAQWPQIVARATLTGHSGQGITIHQKNEPLPNVPLYTKYIKKTFECRIHVMNGSVIDGQIKKKRKEIEDTNNLVRNIHTGWVYCREDYEPDDAAKAIAISAVDALELDFGAVDLIYNQHYNKYYVLEVNTAPGLEGTTLSNYIKGFINVFQIHH